MTPEQIEIERAKFEAWAKVVWLPIVFNGDTKIYEDYDAHNSYRAWLARAEQSAPQGQDEPIPFANIKQSANKVEESKSEDALPKAPPGWKLVPVEPTDKMKDEGKEAEAMPNTWDDYGRIYLAMIEAAPQPPTAEVKHRLGDTSSPTCSENPENRT